MTNEAQEAHMRTLERMIETLSTQLAALGPQWPAHTLGELVAHVFETRWAGLKSEPQIRYRLGKHVLPVFSETQLRDLSAERLEGFARSLRAQPYVHNRVITDMRTAWNMARRWKWIPRDADPLESVILLPEKPRGRSLNATERAAWESARAWLEEHATHAVTRRACRAFRLSLLCAFRPTEAYSLRRDAVDFDKRVAILTKHKTVKFVGPRTVPLPRQAVELLRDTPPLGDSPYFFPGRFPGQPISQPHAAFQIICERAGLKDVQIRDLRRTWGTAALNRGENMKAISVQLGHSSISTTEKHYAHLGLAKQAELSDRMGDNL